MPHPLSGLKPEDLLCAAHSMPEGTWNWSPPTTAELAPSLPGFQLERLVGRGGMGAVYLGRQVDLERPVALKLLPASLGTDPEATERFRREARSIARVRHSNVVEVFDSGTTPEGHLWFSMEYVDGGDLRKWGAGNTGGTGSRETEVLRQICNALEAVHAAGIVHRDLKPANILLTREGTVKVADFGVAGLTDNSQVHRLSRLTMTGTTLGTMGYAAPEQVNGKAVDVRADIYALGVIAYELFTGALPQGVFDPPSAKAGVDPAFDAVVLTAMQSDPARRFQSVADFKAALLRAADVRVQAEIRELELRTKLLRRTRLAVALATLAVLVAALAGWGWVQRQRAVERTAAARRNQVDAEKLIQFLVSEVHDQLTDSSKLDAVTNLMERIAEYFEARPPDPNDSQSLNWRANYLMRRGNTLRKLGQVERALGDSAQSVAMCRQIVALAPADPKPRSRLIVALTFHGYAQASAQAHEAALKTYEEAAGLTEMQPPEDLEIWQAARLAQFRGQLLLDLNRVEAAGRVLRGAIAAFDRWSATHEPSLAGRNHLAELLGLLGQVDERRGDLAGALQGYRRMEEIAERIQAQYPEKQGWRDFQARAQMFAGSALTGLGRTNEAIQKLEAAREVFRRGLDLAPASAYYSGHLAFVEGILKRNAKPPDPSAVEAKALR